MSDEYKVVTESEGDRYAEKHKLARARLAELRADEGFEDRLKHGAVVREQWGSHNLFMYWEIWEATRPRFVVEKTLSDVPVFKAAYDTLEEAQEQFDVLFRAGAIAQAVQALGVGDTVKIKRPPTF